MRLYEMTEAQISVKDCKVVQIIEYYEELLTFHLIASELQEFAFCVYLQIFAKIVVQIYLDIGLFWLCRILLLHLRFYTYFFTFLLGRFLSLILGHVFILVEHLFISLVVGIVS